MSHTLQWLIVRSLAMHTDLLCACVVVWGSPARNKVVKYILMLVT